MPLNPVFRLVAALALLALGWWWGENVGFVAAKHGAIGILLFSPLVAWLLAPLLMELTITAARYPRRKVLEKLGGRYYQFRGYPIEVREDETGHRWLSVEDIRHLLPDLRSNHALLAAHPHRVQPIASHSRRLEIRADALVDLLAPAMAMTSIRFREWARREVLFPSEVRMGKRGRGVVGAFGRANGPPKAGRDVRREEGAL